MSRSLQINGAAWTVSVLGERALLIKPEENNVELSLIHLGTEVLEKAGLHQVTDIIPAYNSIALIYDRLTEDPDKEVQEIQSKLKKISTSEISPQIHKVPVCYELGLDWECVEKCTGLKRKEVIKKHMNSNYSVAMMGFIPGFLYLSGLDEKISCPRKAEPRTKIPAGSVGIAGNQTGVYSLESPGGWQIIGRTPNSFFDPKMNPPSEVKPGDKIEFYSISESEFKKLRTEEGL
ncbi:MAG: 5-oxoprolinase subunit PxpB [Gracilimonas sp.]|uniref:5-oxoprolinase subunit PxpB n=1 Tax=Gracilimonas sp. TaxID=1974203 RepID=UPI003750D700|nr:5-oxoprolinase subunit PxpB [Gracilimonas sp.]